MGEKFWGNPRFRSLDFGTLGTNRRCITRDFSVSGAAVLCRMPCPGIQRPLRLYAWAYDFSPYLFLPANQKGRHSLHLVDVEKGSQVKIETPYTHITQLAASPTDGKLAFLGESPQISQQVSFGRRQMRVVKRSMADNLVPEYYPPP